MYLTDYHIHTDLSLDGRSSLTRICLGAIRNNLKEIAITDHFEPTSADPEYNHYQAEISFQQIEEARRKFQGLLEIRFGIELGQPHLFPHTSEKIIRSHPFDFVLASGHKMLGDVDFADLDYTRINKDFFIGKYLDNLEELVAWNQFDCVAHFDLIKRYSARAGYPLSLTMKHHEQVRRILRTLIDNDKGMEINTSGLRQYSKNCLPDLDVLALYRKLGGYLLTTGSDAHSEGEVGADIIPAVVLASRAGFNYITAYERRRPYHIAIEEQATQSMDLDASA